MMDDTLFLHCNECIVALSLVTEPLPDPVQQHPTKDLPEMMVRKLRIFFLLLRGTQLKCSKNSLLFQLVTYKKYIHNTNTVIYSKGGISTLDID